MIMQHAIRNTQYALRAALRRELKRVIRLRYRLRPVDFSRPYHTHVAGLALDVLPDVFHPGWYYTSNFMARTLLRGDAIHEGQRVLDLGTGSGILALAAARRRATVVATDINPAAVASASANARRHKVSERIDLRQGDMFAPVAGERFDVILSNPPYFRGQPKTTHDLALYAGPRLEWISRLAAEAASYLAPDGRLLVVLGDAAEVGEILGIFADHGWGRRQIAQRDLLHEVLRIFELKPRDA